MKRLLVMFSVLCMLLSACTVSDPSKDTAPAVRDTEPAAVTETAAQTEAAAPPATRYKLEYDITDFSEAYPGLDFINSTIYAKNEKLYLLSQTQTDGETIASILIFDDMGQLTETVPIPKPEHYDISVKNAYYLDDGSFLLRYIDNADRCTYLGILTADGVMERNMYLYSHGINNGLTVIEYTNPWGDYDVHIFASKADGYLYHYDRSFRETELNSDVHGGIRRFLGDDWFSFGYSVYNYQRVNIKTGEVRAYPLHLPSEFDYASLLRGADQQLYIRDDTGIWLYRGNDQPQLILKQLDAGLPQRGGASNGVVIPMNETAVYYRDGGQMLLFRMTRVPDTDTRQPIQLLYLDSRASYMQWLLDAVTRFNNENKDYRVTVQYADQPYEYPVSQEWWTVKLQELMLTGPRPDIVICGDGRLLLPYYDKNVFLDLKPFLDVDFLGCIEEGFAYGGKLYQTPLMMQLDTFAANTAISAGPLTYEAFFSVLENLGENEVLTGASLNTAFFQNAYMDYVDLPGKQAYFDTADFGNTLSKMRTLQKHQMDCIDQYGGSLTWGDQYWSDGTHHGGENLYWTVNGTVGAALESGAMKFLSVDFMNLGAYNAIRLLFGDTAFSLCGYPCTDGIGARVTDVMATAVLWDTDVPDGCAAFLNHLLSDEQQTKEALISGYLPVTRSAMERALDLYRYSYYSKYNVQKIRQQNTTETVYLSPEGISETYNPMFDGIHATADSHYVMEITEADRKILLDFFENAKMRAYTDPFIMTIIDEEVSFWEGNARSLEETIKIIQSRVWIYINE